MNILSYILVAGFWGGSYLGIRYVVGAFPPFFGAAVRVGLALFPLLFFAWRAPGGLCIAPRLIWRVGLAGFLSMGLGWAALFWSEQYVAPAVAAIVTAMTPIFTTLFVPWFDRSAHYARHQWIGVVIGFIGIIIIFAPQIATGPRTELLGLLAVFGTTVMYGISIAMTQPLSRVVAGPVGATWQAIPAVLFLLGLSLATETWPPWEEILAQPRALLALAYLAFCSTALALILWLRLVRNLGGVTASTLMYFVPVVSLLLDAIVLHQWPTRSILIGGVIILSGVALTQSRGRERAASNTISSRPTLEAEQIENC